MASSPAKQGEIMSMGIPIICNSNIGDSDRIIREADGGMIIRTFSADDYDFAIGEIPELLKKSKEKIRQTALHYFSLDVGVKKFNEIYESLGQAGSVNGDDTAARGGSSLHGTPVPPALAGSFGG